LYTSCETTRHMTFLHKEIAHGEFFRTKPKQSGENNSSHHYGCGTHPAHARFHNSSIISSEWLTRLFPAIGIVSRILLLAFWGLKTERTSLPINARKL